jgi:hypothetical protein
MAMGLRQVTLAFLLLAPAVTAISADELSFEKDIRPILKAHCFHCHGEQGEIEGALDVRLKRLLVAGGDSGPAIIPGSPEDSLLIERVLAGEMPPEDKHLSASDTAKLQEWIRQGAPTLRDEPDRLTEETYFTPEELNFWAFQAIRRPSVPSVEPSISVLSPIDAFIQRRLKTQGLGPSPEANRATLLRRLSFDLLGLPPDPEEIETFIEDTRPDAFERQLDRMLSSPHYGERWARHWLDVAGYADSEGYVDADPVREWAFSYRDYVIQAFNDDMPLDQFVLEQLAGDELVSSPLDQLDPDDVRRLTATGFLRMAPDGTSSGGVDQPVARNEVIAETINIVSTSLLGMTVGCARCHNHRYDPITQEDYYQFRALFEPALDWKNWRNTKARQISLYTHEDRKVRDSIEQEAKQAETERQRILDSHLARTLDEELVKAPDDLKASLRTAYKTVAKERTPEQVALLKEYPNIQNISAGSLYLYSEQRARRAGELETAATELQARLISNLRSNCLEELAESDRSALQIILDTPAEQRTPDQLEQLKKQPRLIVTAETLRDFDPSGADQVAAIREMAKICRETDSKKQLADLQQGIADIRARIPKEPFIRALTEPAGHLPETVVFIRGNHTQPDKKVEPGELEIIDRLHSYTIPQNNPDLATSGRRLAYARNLTDGRHPLLSRVLVNQIWLHHFGRGIVNTAGDFGFLGDRPTHPELLDWLATELSDRGWGQKNLHRQMLTSGTWRQSSDRSADLDERDPDNHWYARQSMRRLESEVLRDAMLKTSGVLHTKMFGTPIPVREDEVGQIILGKEELDGERKPVAGSALGAEAQRRSIYIQVRRTRPLATLETFDLPTLSPNCTQRSFSNIAPQSLFLMNSDFMSEYSERFARRVIDEAGPSTLEQAQTAWRLAFGISPSPRQAAQLQSFIESQETSSPSTTTTDAPAANARVEALKTTCRALLASNGYLYVD